MDNITKCVFLDESGSPDITDGDNFYVITASLCNTDNLNEVKAGIKDISDRYFSGAELKSSRTGKSAVLREKVLVELSRLPLYYVVSVIDKSLIHQDSGLVWRKSMYKFSQKLVFNHIYKNMQSTRVVADTFGRTEFMESFKKYIDKNFEPTVFNYNNELLFANPEEETGIQASDFVGGSVRRYFKKDDEIDILKILKNRLISLQLWPERCGQIFIGSQDDKLNAKIRNHCQNIAKTFVENSDDPILKGACELLLYEYSVKDQEYMYGDEILKKLLDQNIIDGSRSKEWLMQKVIAPLRDHGVLISACHDGYKIPNCKEDVQKFISFVESKTEPYLQRLLKMQESLFIGTDIDYDMTEGLSETSLIRKFLKNFKV